MTVPLLGRRRLGKLDATEFLLTLPIMLITFGWAAIAAMFSFSIAMVVWGRNGDNTLGY
jgi:cytochrome b6-f complex subunit 8